MGSEIVSIHGRRVWDSRGRPTVEAEVRLATGAIGRAIAPAGASRGSREATDLRDGGAHLGGNDVTHAVANVNGEICDALTGFDAHDQGAVDATLVALDGTPDPSRRLPPHPKALHCGAIWRARDPSLCRCPRSRSSAAALTPAGASISRT